MNFEKKIYSKKGINIMKHYVFALSFCFGSSTKLHHASQVLILLNLGGLIQLNLPKYDLR